MKKKKLLFIVGILVLACILWLGINHFQKGHYGYITITVDGNELGTYSLGKDQTISIGHTNICEIKDGHGPYDGSHLPGSFVYETACH